MSEFTITVHEELRDALQAVPDRAGGLLETLTAAGFEGGYGFKTGELVITTRGARTEDVEAVIQAFDPNRPTPAQLVEAARAAAAEAVANADLPALTAEVVAAKTLEDVRPALMQALTLVGQMAVASGLVPPDVGAQTRKE